jgi:farnesyl-diphosphate farnesyltransferase
MVDIDRLLLRTSRTFALAIPLLPDPLGREVTIAYLLFRIADTFEDATRWPRAARIEALHAFAGLLRARDGAASGRRPWAPAAPSPCDEAPRLAEAWVAARPCDHDGYLDLLAETPAVLAELDAFWPSRREAIVHHTLRTVEGMADFVGSGDEHGNLRLGTLADLKRYCHVVAGIVGELLTELFLDFSPVLGAARQALWDNATRFGEALQLVNILKDSDSDARHGRVYLPPALARAEILALARDDLRAATDYVLALQSAGGPRGMVAFTALPVLLARATLDRLERFGPGSTVTRADVMDLWGRLHRDLDAGAPALS